MNYLVEILSMHLSLHSSYYYNDRHTDLPAQSSASKNISELLMSVIKYPKRLFCDPGGFMKPAQQFFCILKMACIKTTSSFDFAVINDAVPVAKMKKMYFFIM